MAIKKLSIMHATGSNQGYISATRRQLESVFGKAYDWNGEHDKITTEWVLEIDKVRVTIYDYKNYDENYKIVAPALDEDFTWSIGSNSPLAAALVHKYATQIVAL
jgi:hypothetical protein